MPAADISVNSSHEGRSEETVNRAFRLNKDAFDALHQEARKRNVTANTIVNELVMKYITVDRILKKYHPMIVSSSVLRLFSEELPQDRIIEMAEKAADDILLGDFPVEITGDDSAAGVFRALKTFSLATGEYEYSEEEYDGKRTVILVHNVGKNWSLFIATYWKNLLNRKGVEVKISTTEDAIMLQFRPSDIQV